MEARLSRLTGIIGGTSESGLEIARQKLLEKKAGVAIFDKENNGIIVDLANSAPRIDGVLGEILFVQIDPNDYSTIELAIKVAEGHFSQPLDELVNAREIESQKFSLPSSTLNISKD